jgi:hypothetical protein
MIFVVTHFLEPHINKKTKKMKQKIQKNPKIILEENKKIYQ